jgi:hypothetical protein
VLCLSKCVALTRGQMRSPLVARYRRVDKTLCLLYSKAHCPGGGEYAHFVTACRPHMLHQYLVPSPVLPSARLVPHCSGCSVKDEYTLLEAAAEPVAGGMMFF